MAAPHASIACGRSTGHAAIALDLVQAMLDGGPAIHYAAGPHPHDPLEFVGTEIAGRVGRTADALVAGRVRWSDLIHPEDRAGYLRTVAGLAAGETADVEYRLGTGAQAGWVRDRLRLVAPAGGGTKLLGAAVDVAREKAAECQLRDASAMTSAMMRSALDAIVTIDLDGRVLEFNPEAERMFLYDCAEVLGRPLSDLIIPPEQRSRHAAGLARFRAAAAGASADRRMQVTAQRKDGSTFPAEMTIFHAGEGEGGRFVGEIRDISRRIAADAERDRLTRILRESIDNMPAGFTITGADGRIIVCNEAYARSLGRPVEQIVGRHRDEILDEALCHLRGVDGTPFGPTPEAVAWIRGRLCRPHEKPIELEFGSGETRMVASSVLADGSMACVHTDVTEIRRAERARRESTEAFRKMVEVCPVPIAMMSGEDGLVVCESRASRALYGRDAAADPAYARDSFVDPADRARYRALLQRHGAVDGFEVRMRHTGGREFWAALSGRLIEFQGEPVIVAASVDLTERRALDAEMARQREALHQSEKLAALGELLAGVAHELNNPLSVVVGQALLLAETIDDPVLVERVAKIGRAADRCVRIVKTFLAMARRRPKRAETVDLNDLVRDAVEATSDALRSSDVELKLELSPMLPPVEGDPDQLAQVLTNLVFNAEIALRDIPGVRRMAIATTARAGEVTLSVSDNGPGIAADLRSRVFEPFFTTRSAGNGTGIGLAFCHRVIEDHGGRIGLESAAGAGTTFMVTLPAAASTIPAADAATVPAPPGTRRVLVIDDEVDVADVIAGILRQQGDVVEIALSGDEALCRLRAAPFDAVLSDLRMPGLDGERLFAILERERPDVAARLGFVTGDAMGARAQRFLGASGRPYIEKPVMPADAIALVAAIVDAAAVAA
ncbi:MAG: PAS domain S-box protein [Alphaproteobacteria bacterium]|nr:PAS domain S-box protein [Alphaproteobacteria bacterium]